MVIEGTFCDVGLARPAFKIGIGVAGRCLLLPPTPPYVRVRIRRFGTLRFPNKADLSVEIPSSPSACSPLRCTLEFHSYPPTRAPPRRTSGAHDRDSRHALSLPFGPSHRGGLSYPKPSAPMASADFSLRRLMLPVDVPLSEAKRDLPE